MASDENELMREQMRMLKRRGVSDTDPRVRAIIRILKAQNAPLPKEGIDFPMQLKFKSKEK
jgi:hypothetical protein